MGCGSSKAKEPAPAQQPVQGQMVEPVAPAAGQGKGGGKGSRSKGGGKFQIMLENKFKDYNDDEDMILKRAWMTGQKNVKYKLRGQKYEYNFKKMIQINKETKKERKIRPPRGPKPPSKPILPPGPMIILTVREGQPGTQIQVPDPNNKGKKISVFVPAHAKPGAKMAVPVPSEGESIEDVQKKQKQHDDETGTKGQQWTTGGKVAAGGAAVAGMAAVGVGGVLLGDHLAGGDLATTIGEAAVDVGEDAVDTVADGAPDVIDAAGDWAEGAGEDIGDFFADAGDWFEDAGEDIGAFVMDLF